MLDTGKLHLVVDGACHDVARRQREAFVVFLHKLFAFAVLEDGSGATHSLGDEEGGLFGWVV